MHRYNFWQAASQMLLHYYVATLESDNMHKITNSTMTEVRDGAQNVHQPS